MLSLDVIQLEISFFGGWNGHTHEVHYKMT